LTGPEPARRPDGLPRAAWLFLTGVFIVAVSLVDYKTGSEVSVSFFYLLPIGLATWRVGTRSGVVASVFCVGGWIGAYLLNEPDYAYSRPSILYWNAAVEITIFLSLTFLLSAIRSGLRKERILAQRLDAAYRELDDEMRSVGELQRSLLPTRLPDLPGFRFAVHYAPSTRAGGDYYDFLPLGDGRLGLLIADASGHGAPAAVLMAMMRLLVHADAAALLRPESVLESANAHLNRNIPDIQFVTACYMILDPERPQVEYALAGHPPPLLVRRSSREIEELGSGTGFPLGMFDVSSYQRLTAQLSPGDTLLFYTDGLTEADDGHGAFFGIERVKRILHESRDWELPEIKERLLAELTQHVGTGVISDDVTMVLVRTG
jgi:serine phosphatase RsbU (regulator of sigma subunit)